MEDPSAPTARLTSPMVVPGIHTGVCADRAAALILAPTSHPVVSLIADVLFSEPNLTQLATRLVGQLSDLPPLAVILDEDDGARLLVHGPLHAMVVGADRTTTVVDGTGRLTWTEESVPPGSSVSLVPPGSAQPIASDWMPVGVGLGPAGILAVRLIGGPDDESAPPQPNLAVQLPNPSNDLPSTGANDLTEGNGAYKPASAELDVDYLFRGTGQVDPGTGTATAGGGPGQAHSSPTLPPAKGTSLSTDPPASPGDYLSDEPDSTRIDPPLDNRTLTPDRDISQSELPRPAQDTHIGSDTEQMAATDSLITSVPGMQPSADVDHHEPASHGPAVGNPPPGPPLTSTAAPSTTSEHRSPPPTPPTPETYESTGDPRASDPGGSPEVIEPSNLDGPDDPHLAPSSHDDDLEDITVSLAARRAARARAMADQVPRVQAVLCASGHANPIHSDRCRTCGDTISDRTVHEVARPSLGFLSFDDGTVIEVDRHLVIGRRPSPDPLIGDEPHQLVAVADPDGVVSRTHLVLRLDGWFVSAIDRDSTNLTFVEIPGQPAVQLRPNDEFPLPPGTVVRLGDEVCFTYQSTQR